MHTKWRASFCYIWRYFRGYQLYPYFVVCHGDCEDACSYLNGVQFFKDVVIYNQMCIGDIVVCEFYRRFVYPWKFAVLVADTRDTSNKSCSCERDVDIKWDFENTWQPYRILAMIIWKQIWLVFFHYFYCRFSFVSRRRKLCGFRRWCSNSRIKTKNRRRYCYHHREEYNALDTLNYLDARVRKSWIIR